MEPAAPPLTTNPRANPPTGGVDERSSVVLHLSRRSCLPLEILGTLDMLVNYVEMARVSGVRAAPPPRNPEPYTLDHASRGCVLTTLPRVSAKTTTWRFRV